MPFPEIKHCIICEDVRLEADRKVAVLGMYGIAPDVTIYLHDFERPLMRLVFAMAAHGGGGNFVIETEIKTSAGEKVSSTASLPVTIARPPGFDKGFFTLIYLNTKFPKPDKYTFEMVVDGKKMFSTEFTVMKLPAESLPTP